MNEKIKWILEYFPQKRPLELLLESAENKLGEIKELLNLWQRCSLKDKEFIKKLEEDKKFFENFIENIKRDIKIKIQC
jgi:hypothetical protein